jgi:hypothetical protein
MKLKSLALLGAASLALAAASPAQAAMQRFWVVNFSHLDIYQVYAENDLSRGTRDLMGDNGHLDYNPRKVPDLVQVLAPHGRGCYSDITIVAFDPGAQDGDNPYTARFRHANLCKAGQTFSVSDDSFGY